jgi:hypothetical protein
MAHGDPREGKWRGNWPMEWVASTLHTTSERSVSSISTADAHTSAASSRMNWRTRRFKWTRPFRRKTKSGCCVCAITLQTQSSTWIGWSQCPRGLRRGFTTACLLGLRVWIPPGARMSVCCACGVVWCQVKVSATARSLVQRSPSECGVSECDQGTSYRRSRHTRVVEPQAKSTWIRKYAAPHYRYIRVL